MIDIEQHKELPFAKLAFGRIKMKQASVIIIQMGDSDFLSLLKNNKFGMIGGSLEDTETPLQCAIRELYEETGLRTDLNNLVYLNSNFDETGVFSHLYTSRSLLPAVPSHTSPEGKLVKASKQNLLSDAARFPVWNKWAFHIYDSWRYYHV